MEEMYEISVLGLPLNIAHVADMNVLFAQLSLTPKKIAIMDAALALRDERMVLVVAKLESQVVGMGTLSLLSTLSGMCGSIEDLIVLDAHRGYGLGKQILERLIIIAQERNLVQLQLTSKPLRVAANKLYRDMGFLQMETNVYRLPI